jgi:nucleotide-binding universal stress UspA family protein
MAIQKILVPTDFSDGAQRACEIAARLAKPLGASIHLLHVLHLPVQTITPEVPVVPMGYWRDVVASAESAVAELQRKLEAEGLRVSTEVLEDLPGFAIAHSAARAHADLIVMGTRGTTGIKHAVFGSVAERTVRTAPCPVLTVKADGQAQEAPFQLRNILVGMDFSPSATRALDLAQEFAKRAGGAQLILLHAYDIPIELEPYLIEKGEPALEHLSKDVIAELEVMLARLKSAGLSAEYVARRGRPEQVLIEVARERSADLLALGTHGRRGLSHLLLGSVAERVVRSADCPVLTVRS